MRLLVLASVCLMALYIFDAWFCGGMYFDAAHQIAAQWLGLF